MEIIGEEVVELKYVVWDRRVEGLKNEHQVTEPVGMTLFGSTVTLHVHN